MRFNAEGGKVQQRSHLRSQETFTELGGRWQLSVGLQAAL